MTKKLLKVTYFKYFILDKENEEKKLVNINKLLNGFCKYNNIDYKNSFIFDNENYYLIQPNREKLSNNFYYFISTRNSDIGKIILQDTKNINIDDIDSKLGKGENIGFSSYLMVNNDYIAFSTSVISPKYSRFSVFVNKIFESLKLNDQYEFEIVPFEVKTTIKDAINFDFIGKTSLKISKNSNIISKLFELLCINKPEMLGDVEISIIPKRRESITEESKKLLELIDNKKINNVERIKLHAKNHISENLQDYLIFANTNLKDEIVADNDENRFKAMQDKASNNNYLKEKIKENKDNFTNINYNLFDKYNDNNNNVWDDIIVNNKLTD